MNQSVLISGGGIVGAFLGMELASRNIPFTIIEKNLPTPSEFDEIRSLTLNSTAHERLNEPVSYTHLTLPTNREV